MRVALMIEGQEDVTWEDWVALAEACEASGIEALFRSDHYLSVGGHPERGALDAWGTINALAARTTTLRLGTMVSPSSFRHPSVLGKLATTADHVSGGRIELGLGTGWSEVEHTAYGFPFLSMRERMDVLEEQLAIIHDGHWGDDDNYSFAGAHYTLRDLSAYPKPVQAPHPPLILGGAAGPRAARLAARYADEYNTVMPTLEEAVERKARIDAACAAAGRDPIPFSMMGPLPGPVGDATIATLKGFAQAGVARVFVQHLEHRDLATVTRIGQELVPPLAQA
ncbi:F420-dependent glucose-6-phosphate dehydrogenase [Baekduia alba]|uniref:TIGR03560 family F420-dependent LLM class oxidoreductase n=1 Tax=Baekduia alba TaxID=2997333 RepID=UPI00234243F0|nr:TIGR03560 family F420-dependent LLM class oxidoreductase [Baekduia alba]WCB94103.1 F420-dependent glucose-6-phosphate dehydrogenase [Baekduia alba]